MTRRRLKAAAGVTIDQQEREAFRAAQATRIPLGFTGNAYEQAYEVLYLVSDAARFLTGSVFAPTAAARCCGDAGRSTSVGIDFKKTSRKQEPMTVVGARSRFESLISEGRKPVGAFLTSSDPSTSVIFGDVGFDFVIIDGEHGALDTRDVLNHIRAARSVGCLAIVRVLHNEAALIQRAVDLGADGVIVPKVGTAGDAERALAATRYQPGGRGFCPMVPAAAWSGENWSEHAGNSNSNVILIPLIETIAGVENFGEIVAVPGIDYAFFGLGDLSQELGIDMVGGRDQLIAQWEVLRDKADIEGVRLGAPLGCGFAGVDFGAAGGDLSLLRQAAKARLAAAVEELQAGPVAVNVGTSPN